MERTPIISHHTGGKSSPSSGPTSRSPSQRQRIIELLRQNGKAGLLTGDFLRIPIARYSSRLRELRQQGYEISTERITESSAIAAISSALSASDDTNCAAMIV